MDIIPMCDEIIRHELRKKDQQNYISIIYKTYIYKSGCGIPEKVKI